ncbi:MAG: DUF6503 family protein [Cyclobacteriaceae bacterium]
MRPYKVGYKNKIIVVMVCLAFYSCVNDKSQQIVDKCIEKHGGAAYETLKVGFDFRDRHYTAVRNKGSFTYTREFSDSTGNIRDVLDNAGFVRYRGGKAAEITDERRNAFTNSVNAVIYFALLPSGLNDDAVNKEWIEQTTIKGEPYDLIRITFDPHGGGKDHQDEFLYWIHQENSTLDYMAYSYEVDGGGLRFREAMNPRQVGGILFQDYINYQPEDERIPIRQVQSLFTTGKLKKLSEIKLDNLQVINLNE